MPPLTYGRCGIYCVIPHHRALTGLVDMLGLPSSDERPRGRFASSVLVITVPILLMALLALLTGGSGDLGTPELSLLALIWVIGLLWVWWPWRRRHHT